MAYEMTRFDTLGLQGEYGVGGLEYEANQTNHDLKYFEIEVIPNEYQEYPVSYVIIVYPIDTDYDYEDYSSDTMISMLSNRFYADTSYYPEGGKNEARRVLKDYEEEVEYINDVLDQLEDMYPLRRIHRASMNNTQANTSSVFGKMFSSNAKTRKPKTKKKGRR